MEYSRLVGVVAVASTVSLTFAACGSSTGSSFGDAGPGGGGGEGGNGLGGGDASLSHDTGSLKGPPMKDSSVSMDAFFANDPPPMYCGVDAGAVTPITGTLDCPSDKNREGCPCPTQGMTAPCWPGLRVDRNVGQCKDGMTTCDPSNEGLSLAWGACNGYVLPTPGATAGAAACQCFSSGKWAIDNLEPCFETDGSSTYAVSTYVSGSTIMCPSSMTVPPPVPSDPWSTDTLTVDCEGQFQLCYTLKAGMASAPSPSDCVVAGPICTSAYYTTPNMPQTFPALPGWTGLNPSSNCAAQFASTGGYGEMSVTGKSELCEVIDNGMGGALVFNRVQYCPTSCQTDPSGPGCTNCMAGGSGGFGQ
jgi:hypothetical protein